MNRSIPAVSGCRRWPPAADETGMTPPRDAAPAGSWIYGEPQTGGVPEEVAAGGMTGASVTVPGGDTTAIPIPGMNGDGVPGGVSAAAAQGERMRNPVSMAETHTPGSAQTAYQSSLRCLLDRNIGYFMVATFLIGTGQSVTWQGILHTVGSDYMVLYQPDYDRYISCDLYSLKFAQFHNVKGIPYCAASQGWQGQTRF